MTPRFIVLLFLVLFTPFLSRDAWGATRSEPLIVDHNAVMQFDQIPDYWLEQAKQLTFHYAHTSHGGQIICGLLELEEVDSRYSVAVRQSSSSPNLPAAENPPALRIYDGNPPETYITPDGYWQGSSAINRTRAVADTGYFDFSMWSWCGQQSDNDVETVQEYLRVLDQLEKEYPQMNFIYMTGHTDGTQDNANSTLKRNNNLVRDYVKANNKILFDFADIESWDPAGNHYHNTTDACSWCENWCNSHPACLPYNPGDNCFNHDQTNTWYCCDHSHRFNCFIKAKAFWWMMARLAGWNSATPPSPSPSLFPSPSPSSSVVPSPSSSPGDINQDGKVNVLDIFILLDQWLTSNGQSDINQDGKVNTLDLSVIINNWGH